MQQVRIVHKNNYVCRNSTVMMVTIKRVILWIVVAGSLHACTFDEMAYKGIKNIKLREIKGKKVSLSCDVILDNPNKQTLKVRPSSFDFYINDQQLGIAHLDKPVKILKQSESTIHVPITIELFEGTLPHLIGATLKQTTRIRLIGTAKGAVFIFGAKRKIDVSKEVSLRNLKLGNMPFFNK